MPYLPCQSCGFIRHTNPNAFECVKCRTIRLRREKNQEFAIRVKARGCELLTPIHSITDNKMNVEVFRKECGHTFKAQIRNIMSGATICGICGPQKRMANALKHWLKKYAKTADYSKFEDYRYVVRKLSEKVYKLHIDTLNPERKVRSRPDLVKGCVQLDHIKPIIECFKEGLPPEQAAAIENLRVIDAIVNLSKQRF